MIGRTRVPSSPIRFCMENLLNLDGVVITGSSEASGSPAINLRQPERPMLPWRSTSQGAGQLGTILSKLGLFRLGSPPVLAAGGNVVIDFLNAETLTGLWLIRTNFTQVTIQGNATNVWTSPSFSRSYTIARNPWNYRYQLSVPLSGFSYRYLRILIPAQSPIDGTSSYLLGGIYAGVLEQLPQNFKFDVEFTTVHPRQDVVQQYGAWRQRLVMGEPLVRLSTTRMARTTRLAPAYQDDLQLWLDIERRIRNNDFFALMMGSSDTSQGFVVRPINDGHQKWSRPNYLRAQSNLELEECLGP